MARFDRAQWNPIETAPLDGTKVRAAHFSGPACCDWACKAAFKLPRGSSKLTWMEVDGVRGEVFLAPTHWLPLN